MKVYIVTETMYGEDTHIIGVFKDRQSAEKEIKGKEWLPFTYEIEAWEVQE